MEQQDIYRLRLLSPLHIGERGAGMEETAATVPSDTLFSALCLALLELEGRGWLYDWLDAFTRHPAPFLITSTFPWAGEVRFYPRPMLKFPLSGGPRWPAQHPQGKLFKKITHVSEGIFQRTLAGQSLEEEREEDNFLPGGLWITAAERKALPDDLRQIWDSSSQVAHVALDRASSAPSLYHVGEARYAGGCGLWFAVRWREPAWRELLEKALSCLGEAGIGGERSAGRGQFKGERWEGAGLPTTPHGGRRAVTLSLYHPAAGEVSAGLLDSASYRFRVRRGWIASPEGQGWRRKAVRMLAEGSVVDIDARGDLVDATPEGFTPHRVYRYGLAFPVAVAEDADG